MKLAVAMCEPGPIWLGPMFALPTTVPSPSTATTVWPGGSFIQIARARSSPMSRSQVKVSPAATISRRKGQIEAQSAAIASLIRIIDRRCRGSARRSPRDPGVRCPS